MPGRSVRRVNSTGIQPGRIISQASALIKERVKNDKEGRKRENTAQSGKSKINGEEERRVSGKKGKNEDGTRKKGKAY